MIKLTYSMVGSKISKETIHRALLIACTDDETRENLSRIKEIRVVPKTECSGGMAITDLDNPDVIKVADIADLSPEELVGPLVHEGVHTAQIRSGKIAPGTRELSMAIIDAEIEAYSKDIKVRKKLVAIMKPCRVKTRMNKQMLREANYLKVLVSIKVGNW